MNIGDQIRSEIFQEIIEKSKYGPITINSKFLCLDLKTKDNVNGIFYFSVDIVFCAIWGKYEWFKKDCTYDFDHYATTLALDDDFVEKFEFMYEDASNQRNDELELRSGEN